MARSLAHCPAKIKLRSLPPPSPKTGFSPVRIFDFTVCEIDVYLVSTSEESDKITHGGIGIWSAGGEAALSSSVLRFASGQAQGARRKTKTHSALSADSAWGSSSAFSALSAWVSSAGLGAAAFFRTRARAPLGRFWKYARLSANYPRCQSMRSSGVIEAGRNSGRFGSS